jgi:hypothetical protein
MARLICADISVITFHTECSNLYMLSTPCHLAAKVAGFYHQARSQNCEKQILSSTCLSVCTELGALWWIFMKCDFDFFENQSRQ